MGHLVSAKQMIIDVLNRVKSIGTFNKTANGFEVVNPEGYVAIDKTGSAVKLVDRMEFAFNNFTAQKNWDKMKTFNNFITEAKTKVQLLHLVDSIHLLQDTKNL